LGLKPEQTHGLLQITHILKQAEGGLSQVINSLRGYDEEDAQNFIEKYDSISATDRSRVSIEEIAIAGGVEPLDLLAAATKALVIENQTVAAIIATTSHPKVVKKTISAALQDGGHRDREMIHTALGFLPTQKGSTFITNRIQVANFKDGPQSAPDENLPAPDAVDLPGFESDIIGMEGVEKKLLKA
jgi:hypothetical protein